MILPVDMNPQLNCLGHYGYGGGWVGSGMICPRCVRSHQCYERLLAALGTSDDAAVRLEIARNDQNGKGDRDGNELRYQSGTGAVNLAGDRSKDKPRGFTEGPPR